MTIHSARSFGDPLFSLVTELLQFSCGSELGKGEKLPKESVFTWHPSLKPAVMKEYN